LGGEALEPAFGSAKDDADESLRPVPARADLV